MGQEGPTLRYLSSRSSSWLSETGGHPVTERAKAWEWLQVVRGTLAAMNQQTQRV